MWNRAQIFKLTVTLLFWAAFVALLLPFYSELLLAAVFALAMKPWIARLVKRRRWRWRLTVALVLSAFLIGSTVPISVVIYKAYIYVREISSLGLQNTPFYQKIVLLKVEIVEFANRALAAAHMEDRVDLPGVFEDGAGRFANFCLRTFSAFVSEIPNILLSFFIFAAALYFFLAEAISLKRIVLRQRVLTAAELDRLLKILQSSSFNTVVSSMVIASLQASMVAIGSMFLGVGDFAVIWTVTFFCSFVPVIGAGPVAFALGLGQLIMGAYGLAAEFLVLSVVVGTVDNLIRPYLIASGADDLHPILSLVAIIGALILFGMPGLFLGPVIASVAVRIVTTLYNKPEPVITASGKDLAKTTP